MLQGRPLPKSNGSSNELGDDDYEEREAASKALEAPGEAARIGWVGEGRAPVAPGMPRSVGGPKKLVRALDAKIYRELRRTQGTQGIRMGDSCQPGLASRLCPGSWDDTVRLWDLQYRKRIEMLRGPQGCCVWRSGFTPDGKQLLTGSCRQETMRLWDVGVRQRTAAAVRGPERECRQHGSSKSRRLKKQALWGRLG